MSGGEYKVSVTKTIQPNIVSPEFKANPFTFLAQLRTSQPVYQTTLPDKTPVWLITRYADVTALLKDERFVKNRRTAMTLEQLRKMPWVPPMFRPLERNMLDLDAPDHTPLRALVHRRLRPASSDGCATGLKLWRMKLLERAMSAGEIDVIKDYALPLPMTIITEILGVPARDHHKFHKWSKAVVSLTSPKATMRVIPTVWMFIRYLRQFFKMRRRDPRDDLATALIIVGVAHRQFPS